MCALTISAAGSGHAGQEGHDVPRVRRPWKVVYYQDVQSARTSGGALVNHAYAGSAGLLKEGAHVTGRWRVPARTWPPKVKTASKTATSGVEKSLVLHNPCTRS